MTLVRDGVVGMPWEEVSSHPHFSPDGEHVAFSARRGKEWCAVLDDVSRPGFARVGPPRFSATGHLGYVAMERDAAGAETYRTVVDGLELPRMTDRSLVTDDEDFLFSPDGEHVATAGRIQDWWRPVVDATIGPGGERRWQRDVRRRSRLVHRRRRRRTPSRDDAPADRLTLAAAGMRPRGPGGDRRIAGPRRPAGVPVRGQAVVVSARRGLGVWEQPVRTAPASPQTTSRRRPVSTS